jgi:hypothetical protein
MTATETLDTLPLWLISARSRQIRAGLPAIASALGERRAVGGKVLNF